MRRSKDKSLAMAKADRYFAEFIRLRDSEAGFAMCCTCGKRTTTFDAGHFLSRRHQSTRYHEQNVHAQCTRCNWKESGNQYEHSLFIDAKYGAGTADQLRLLSKMRCARKQDDFERIAEHYAHKVKELKRARE